MKHFTRIFSLFALMCFTFFPSLSIKPNSAWDSINLSNIDFDALDEPDETFDDSSFDDDRSQNLFASDFHDAMTSDPSTSPMNDNLFSLDADPFGDDMFGFEYEDDADLDELDLQSLEELEADMAESPSDINIYTGSDDDHDQTFTENIAGLSGAGLSGAGLGAVAVGQQLFAHARDKEDKAEAAKEIGKQIFHTLDQKAGMEAQRMMTGQGGSGGGMTSGMMEAGIAYKLGQHEDRMYERQTYGPDPYRSSGDPRYQPSYGHHQHNYYQDSPHDYEPSYDRYQSERRPRSRDDDYYRRPTSSPRRRSVISRTHRRRG